MPLELLILEVTIQLGKHYILPLLFDREILMPVHLFSKDILARWTFPLVPDDNHPGGHSYEHLRGNKYIAKGNSVVLSRYVPSHFPSTPIT